MSQTVITTAFEQLKAQQAANNSVLTLDEFIFANIPDLNITDPIDREESWPDASQIVHRQAVSKTGMVNGNAVVYSVVMGADVGDFEFNWVGLISRASNTVAMIVHAPLQKKIKTASGQQGNVLTRSFLMEYDGASQQTQIITPVDTWQIDFTARLAGVDERQHLENIDIYGPAGFLNNGWFVTKKNSDKYDVQSGVGYIAGLRAELLENQEITINAKPTKIWVDVCWRGTLTSAWVSVSKITVAQELANYNENGEQHYVFAIAEIDDTGSVTDLRPVGSQIERNIPTSGRWLNDKWFRSSGKYIKTPGARRVKVTITGAGGGGGGCFNGGAADNNFSGAGAAAGSTGIKWFDADEIDGLVVTIGAGGTEAQKGGDSLFAGIVAKGGAPSLAVGVFASGGLGEEGTGADINIAGGDGGDGQNGQQLLTGFGGSSYWGGGRRSGSAKVGGEGMKKASVPGAGGSGCFDLQVQNTRFYGGTGGDGIALFEEFA
ncbi:phage tail protein [Escherichia coli]|nr:hypothetical protein [Escherichia coli]EIM5968506.1 phage tail protein [Escherichia coli]EJZ1805538.1 phage tail protein [Escherichia coli]EKK1029058.1 phage tail protein [Escherichia coli]